MIYGNVELYNVAELLEPEEGPGKIFSRIPDELRLSLNESACNAAKGAAGCEVRFNLLGDSARVTLVCDRPARHVPPIAEVFQGCFPVSWHLIETKHTVIEVSLPARIELLDKLTRDNRLPFDAYLTRVILPYNPPLRLIDLSGRTAPPRNDQTPDKKYLAYGSSITHGARAVRPTGTYAMRIAEILGADLINIGFGGGAYCEAQIADYIAGRKDWHFLSLEMGINMIKVEEFEPDVFAERVEYLLGKVTETHPQKWVFCTDLFTCRHDFIPPFNKRIPEYRNSVKEAVEKLNTPRLVYIDGRDILPGGLGLAGDVTHPSAQGIEIIAEKLSALMRRKLAEG